MNYNIEFQIEGLFFIILVLVMYFSKPKLRTRQNKIFMYQILDSAVLLVFDIVSCIFIAKRQTYPVLNMFFGKAYIIAMLLWITISMEYIISCVSHERMKESVKNLCLILSGVLAFACFILCIVAISTELKFEGEGRIVYSYGVPSALTYIYSAICSAVAFILLFANWKHISFRRKVPVVAFLLSIGIPALLQSIFPKLLLLGFGCALAELIMYMALENPDQEYILKIEKLEKEKRFLFENIVPKPVAEKTDYKVRPYYFTSETACVGYIKIQNLTEVSKKVGCQDCVDLVDRFYVQIDSILDNYAIEKVSVTGSLYQIASGLFTDDETVVLNMIQFMLAVRSIISGISLVSGIKLNVGFGIDYGRTCQTVTGKKKVVYHLMGPTPERARILAECSDPDQITCSKAVADKTDDVYQFLPINSAYTEDTESFFVLKNN